MSVGPVPGSIQSMTTAMEALRRSVGRIHGPLSATRESVVLFGSALDNASGIVARFSHYGIGGMHAQMMIQVADMKRNMEVSRRLTVEMNLFAESSIRARDAWKNVDVAVNKFVLNLGTSGNKTLILLGTIADKLVGDFQNVFGDLRGGLKGFINSIFPKDMADRLNKRLDAFAGLGPAQKWAIQKQQELLLNKLARGEITREQAHKAGVNPWQAVLGGIAFNMDNPVAGFPEARRFFLEGKKRQRLLNRDQNPLGVPVGGAAGGIDRNLPRDVKPADAQRKVIEADIARLEKQKQKAEAAHDDEAAKGAQYLIDIRKKKLRDMQNQLRVLIPPGLLAGDAMAQFGGHQMPGMAHRGHNVRHPMGHQPFGPNPFGQGMNHGGIGGMFPGMMFPGGMVNGPLRNMKDWEKELASGHPGKAVDAMAFEMQKDHRFKHLNLNKIYELSRDAIERTRPGGIGRLAEMADAEKMSQENIKRRLKQGGPPTPQEQLQKGMIDKENDRRHNQQQLQKNMIGKENDRRKTQQALQNKMIQDYDKASADRQAAAVRHRETIVQQARQLNEAFFSRKKSEMAGMADRITVRQQSSHPMAIPPHPLSPMAPISGPSATSSVPTPQAPIREASTAPQSWGNK